MEEELKTLSSSHMVAYSNSIQPNEVGIIHIFIVYKL